MRTGAMSVAAGRFEDSPLSVCLVVRLTARQAAIIAIAYHDRLIEHTLESRTWMPFELMLLNESDINYNFILFLGLKNLLRPRNQMQRHSSKAITKGSGGGESEWLKR